MTTLENMYTGMVNSPQTTLSSGIDATAATVAVANLEVFPDGPGEATIGTDETAETIYYASKSAASGAGNLQGVS